MSLTTLLGSNPNTPNVAVNTAAAVKSVSEKHPTSSLSRLLKPMIIAGTLAMATFSGTVDAVAGETSQRIESGRRIFSIFDKGKNPETNRILIEVQRNVQREENNRLREAQRARNAQILAEQRARVEAQRERNAQILAERRAKIEEDRAIRAAQRAPSQELAAREARIRDAVRLRKIQEQERQLGIE